MKSKMTSLFSFLILGLVLSGISYAMWSKTLYMNGTVYTGTLDAHFSAAASSDPPIVGSLDTQNTTSWTYDPVTGFVWHGFTYDKDVANTTVAIGTTVTLNDTLFVQMNDTYPSYNASVAFTIDNIGTIPFNAYVFLPPTVTPPIGGTAADLTMGLQGFVNGTQVENGQYVLGWIWIHTEQSAVQNAEYDFNVTFKAVQYNEPLP
jgi:hypothetical protein